MISNKKYIAVEGAIGVGKTTLVKRISNSIKCDTMFEDYADNPFLKLFMILILIILFLHNYIFF